MLPIDLQLESIFSAYKAIHKAGVAHRDIACRNMRIVWDAHRSTMPRIVILDFDRAVTAQDCWTVFTEQQSMREFLLELAASDSSGCVSDWVVGSGAVLYDRFPLDLLPPHKREAAPAVQSDELGLPNGR